MCMQKQQRCYINAIGSVQCVQGAKNGEAEMKISKNVARVASAFFKRLAAFFVFVVEIMPKSMQQVHLDS